MPFNQPCILRCRKAILFFILLTAVYASPTCAQSYTIKDSIEIYKLLDKADEDDLAGNLDKALEHAISALDLSLKRKMSRGAGFAYLKMADLHLKKDGSTGINSLYDKAFAIGAQIRDSFLLGLAHHQLGQFYRDQSKFELASESYGLALGFYHALKEQNYSAIVYNDRGFVQERQGKFDSASAMYLQAIRLFEKENNIKEAANTTGNLGITRYKMGLREEAIELFKQSAAMRETIRDVKGLAAVYGNLVTAYSALNQLDSALKYQQLAIKHAEKTGVKNTLAQAYTNTSVLLSRKQQYEEALQYEMKAVALYGDMGDKLKQGTRFIAIAGLYDKLRDSVTAESYYNKAVALAVFVNNKPLVQSIYQARSGFYAGHQNHVQALDQYKKFILIRDSLMSEQVSANLNEQKIKYETEKKDNEITWLKSEEKIRQLELEKQKALAAGHLAEAGRKQDQITLLKQQEELRGLQLKQKQEELEKQELLARESEQQMLQSMQNLQIAENEKKLRQRQLERERLLRNGIIALSLAMLFIGGLLFNRFQLRKKIQEQKRMLDVRNKISKDLHDDIGSTLTSIHIMSTVSQQALEQNPQQAKEMLQDIAEQSRTIQQNMSDIVWAIRPDNDKVGDLSSRMLEYIGQTLEARQVETRFVAADEALGLTLPMEIRKELLLIFKEAINNILKHAVASKVEITLSVSDHKRLMLRISDNGKWKSNAYRTGTGTRSMQQRASALGGEVRIEGSDAGTIVMVTLPIP